MHIYQCVLVAFFALNWAIITYILRMICLQTGCEFLKRKT